MKIRVLSVLLIALIVAGAGHFFGIVGALVALPLAILINIVTEKLINRVQPSQAIDTLRRR